MTMSSEKRIEVAERLRVYANGFDFEGSNPYWYLMKAVFGDVLIHGHKDVFSRLADLIDPTCRVSDEEVAHQPTLDALAVHVYTCNACHNPFYMADVCCHPKPAYCPYCGARVARDHE